MHCLELDVRELEKRQTFLAMLDDFQNVYDKIDTALEEAAETTKEDDQDTSSARKRADQLVAQGSDFMKVGQVAGDQVTQDSLFSKEMQAMREKGMATIEGQHYAAMDDAAEAPDLAVRVVLTFQFNSEALCARVCVFRCYSRGKLNVI